MTSGGGTETMSTRAEVSNFLRGEDFTLNPTDFALAVETLDRLAQASQDTEDRDDLIFAANVVEAVYRHLNHIVAGRKP